MGPLLIFLLAFVAGFLVACFLLILSCVRKD